MWSKPLSFLCSLALMLSTCSLFAAPKAQLWAVWEAHKPNSTKIIKHTAWTEFLKTYLVSKHGTNFIAYSNISAKQREALENYLHALQAVRIHQYNRNEQLAFWINLYNALTVKLVLDHYPVTSIRDITLDNSVLATGLWDTKLVTVESQALSLNDITHRILRPIWQDPRIHYALSSAALGSPNLQKTAFTATSVYNMLDKAAIDFVNSPRGVNIEDGKLTVSEIYLWYRKDFGETDAGIIQHLLKYAKPGLGKKLKAYDAISGGAFDWSLNDARAIKNLPQE
jgi:hypothetical protein